MSATIKQQKFEPEDFIAILVLGGGMALHLAGKGEFVTPMMIAIVFYYFGKKENML